MSKFRNRLLLGVAVAVAIVGTWFVWFRDTPAPTPPTIDLSRADPEVAAVVTKAVATVAAAPRDAGAWGRLGMVLRAHDFDTDSVAALQTAERLDPTDYRWPYLQGLTRVLYEPDAGLDCLRRAAERAPTNRTEPRLRYAETLLDRGRLDDAEAQTRDLSSDPRAQLLRTHIAAERGDWAAMLSLSEQLQDVPACRQRAAALRADAFQRLGKPDDAASQWKRTATLPSDEPWPDRFVQEVEQLRVGPTAKLREASALLGRGRGPEAILVLRGAATQYPKASELRLMLGEVLNRAGTYADARAVLVDLTKQFPDLVEGWFQLGVAEFQLGNTAAAAAAFERVVELKPDHARGYFNLGHSRKKAGDRSGSVLAFEAALRCRPDYEAAREALKTVKPK